MSWNNIGKGLLGLVWIISLIFASYITYRLTEDRNQCPTVAGLVAHSSARHSNGDQWCYYQVSRKVATTSIEVKL